MSVLRAVILDLWTFFLAELRVLFASSRSATSITPATSEPRLLPDASQYQTAVTPVVQAPVAAIPSVPDQSASPQLQRLIVAYAQVPCYLRPEIKLDTKLGELSYGTVVTVLSTRPGWCQVITPEIEGWIEESHVVSDRSVVLPQFTDTVSYDADHPETLKVRAYLNDEFGASLLRLPLQDIEYVSYRLKVTSRSFAWPRVRPRIAGRWHEILSSVQAVQVSESPITDSVLEYYDPLYGGQVYYVDEVRPDETIVVTGVPSDGTGTFVRIVVPEEQWRQWAARFIVRI